MEYGKFRSKNNKTVLARFTDNKWLIVELVKEKVRAHRENRNVKPEDARQLGTTLKEVEKVKKELSNDEFKASYFPACVEAVRIYEDAPELKPIPKPTPRPVPRSASNTKED
jgi:hypothetical protein